MPQSWTPLNLCIRGYTQRTASQHSPYGEIRLRHGHSNGYIGDWRVDAPWPQKLEVRSRFRRLNLLWLTSNFDWIELGLKSLRGRGPTKISCAAISCPDACVNFRHTNAMFHTDIIKIYNIRKGVFHNLKWSRKPCGKAYLKVSVKQHGKESDKAWESRKTPTSSWKLTVATHVTYFDIAPYLKSFRILCMTITLRINCFSLRLRRSQPHGF